MHYDFVKTVEWTDYDNNIVWCIHHRIGFGEPDANGDYSKQMDLFYRVSDISLPLHDGDTHDGYIIDSVSEYSVLIDGARTLVGRASSLVDNYVYRNERDAITQCRIDADNDLMTYIDRKDTFERTFLCDL
jgi:hypothetical protein